MDGYDKMKKSVLGFEQLSKYRSALMGLQILLIIFFHFTEDCKTYDVRYDGLIYIFYNYIRSSGVDIFLILSGMGLYFSWKKTPVYKTFYKKRLIRTLIPYFIVCIPAWIWLDLFIEKESVWTFFKDVTFLSFFTDGEKWFWYILMVIVCYLVFPFVFEVIEKCGDRITERMRVIDLCVITTVVLIMLQLYHNDLYSNISIAVSRFPAFFVGVYLGKATYEKRTIPVRSVVIMAIAAVILTGPLEMMDKKILGTYSLAFLNFSLCLLILVLFEKMEDSEKKLLKKSGMLVTTALSWFGKYTIELYLIHVAVRKILKNLGYPTYRLSYEGFLIVISVLLSVLVSGISARISSRIDKKSIRSK